MRYLPTSKLTPGMALGQDIYDGAGRLLLAKHLLLSEEYISNLEFLVKGRQKKGAGQGTTECS